MRDGVQGHVPRPIAHGVGSYKKTAEILQERTLCAMVLSGRLAFVYEVVHPGHQNRATQHIAQNHG